MDAINGLRMQSREMADGTIEVKIHVDKSLRHEFYRLFPDIGFPIAIAPLNLEVDLDQKPKEIVGDLCRMACNFCKDPLFQNWTNSKDEEEAKAWILFKCRVSSRKDIDNNITSKQIFLEEVRKPFLAIKRG